MYSKNNRICSHFNLMSSAFLITGLVLSFAAQAQSLRNEQYFNNLHGTEYRVRKDIVFSPGRNVLIFSDQSLNSGVPMVSFTATCRLTILTPPVESQSGYVISKRDVLTVIDSNKTFTYDRVETPQEGIVFGTNYDQSTHHLKLQTISGTHLQVTCIDVAGNAYANTRRYTPTSLSFFEQVFRHHLRRVSPYPTNISNQKPDPVRL